MPMIPLFSAVMPEPVPSAMRPFFMNSFILPCQQMGFDLSRRIQRHADDNQKGRSSKIERTLKELIRRLGSTQTTET